MNRARGRRVTIIKTSTGNGARRREIAGISDFEMLALASETSIYARTAQINCYYLMTLSVFGAQLKRAVVNKNVGNFPVNWPKLLGPFQNCFTMFFSIYMCLECHSASHPLKRNQISFLKIVCRRVAVNNPMPLGVSNT